MHDTTPEAAPTPARRAGFPDDELRDLLRHLVRMGGLLEPSRLMTPHDHAGFKVSTSEVFALGELAEGGAMSQQELADRLGLEKSTVSRLAGGLESRGWIARERDPENRRFYRLALTDLGHEATRRIGDDLHRHHGRVLARLTADERRALSLGLTALVRAMAEEHLGHPGHDGHRERHG